MLNSNHDDDVTPILEGKYKVYRRRYYILFLFWINSLCVGISWITFGPIAHSVQDVFQMNDGDIALLNNWASISFLLFFVPACIILEKFGLRVSMVIFGGFTTLGVGIRCLAYWGTASEQARWIFNIGQFLGGLSQPLAQIAPPAVSAVWFPPEQRNMATAVTSTSIALGAGLVSLIEPIFVKEYNFSRHENGTNMNEEYEEEFNSIINVFVGQFVFTLTFYIALVIYFPGKPPTPPSQTQAENTGPVIPALKDLARNKDYWLLSMGVYFMLGIYFSWFSMLDVTLKELGFLQSSVGPMMFIQTIGSAITSLLLGILVDFLKRRHKVLMVPSFVIGAISMIVYILEYLNVIPRSTASLFGTFVILGVFLIGALPLVMEVLAEISYPVSENVVLAVPAFLLNISNTVTLLIPMIPGAGVVWLNWCWLVGAICIPISAALVKVNYKRSDCDKYT